MAMKEKAYPILLSLGLALFAVACGGSSASRSADHGTLSNLSSGTSAYLCEHDVPGDVCTRCNPELEADFRAVNDWCGPHGIPESQCHRCHPNLTFEPMPELEAEADWQDVSHEDALRGLDAVIVEGRVTVVEFAAAWCVACRNLELRLREHVNSDPTLAVRRIAVEHWNGEIVDTYLSQATALPVVFVYDADGRRVGDADSATWQDLQRLIERAGDSR